MTTPEERLRELFAKVDAFFARAAAAFPAPGGMTCHAGCDDCCRRRLSVTELEADAIAAHVGAMPAASRAVLAAALESSDPGACAALVDGRCAIYEARPIVCRSHGLPIRFDALDVDEPGTRRSLPVVDACPRNFRGYALPSLPAAAVLDQTTLSTVLGALDAARADAAGSPRGRRVELSALLARCADL